MKQELYTEIEHIHENTEITKELEITIRGQVAKDFKRYMHEKRLSKQKTLILHLLNEHSDNEGWMSLEEISTKMKISLPLLSYHVNGNLKSDGLKTDEAVECKEVKGRSYLRITDYGNILLRFATKV